jgi:hypothetical protein
MSGPIYKLQAKWKEELICRLGEKEFVLEFPMGVPTVYFPTEEKWPGVCPSWAVGHWAALHDQLKLWCSSNNVKFIVDATANVYA